MSLSRSAVISLLSFVLLSGGLALYVSLSAPVGSWRTLAFNAYDIQDNADPDGLYLPSAVAFDNEGRFPFVLGTPGITLHYMLYGVERAYYFVASPANVSFMEFCVKNWDRVHVVARCACAAVVIASVCLFFFVLQRLGLDASTAVLGSQLYFLSFPVLIFLTKITPEGLMVLFFLLNYWYAIKYRETGRLVDIVFSACFCALALGSKVHYLFMLPVINVAYIWFVRRDVAFKAVALFAVVLLLCGLVLLVNFDLRQWVSGWQNFIAYYYQNLSKLTGGQAPKSMSLLGAVGSFEAVASSFFMDVIALRVAKSELHFVLLSLVPLFCLGLIGIMKHRHWNADELFLAATVFCGMPVVLFRGSYHYWFFCIMLMSLFGSRYITGHILQPSAKKYALFVAVFLSISSIVGFVYAKSYDIAYYKKNVGPYYSALHAIAYGQRVGILRSPYANTWQNIGGFYLSFGLDEHLRLARAFRDNFAPIDAVTQESLYRNYVFAWVAESKTGFDVAVCGAH